MLIGTIETYITIDRNKGVILLLGYILYIIYILMR